MTAQATTPIHYIGQIGSDPTAEGPEHDDDDLLSPETPVEPVNPVTAQRRQLLALVPNPKQFAAIGGGVAAVAIGGAAGYWLARDRAAKRRRPLRRAAGTADAAIDLVPAVLQLMANPIVRTLALRVLMRQIGRRVSR